MCAGFRARPWPEHSPSAAGFKIGGDTRGAERVAADPDARPEIGGAALDHPPGVDAVHRLFGQRSGAASGGAEEGSLAVVADASGFDVGVEVGFKIMMRRHLMALAAFLMQPHPPALALGVVILDPHGDGRADAGEGEGQRSISRPTRGQDTKVFIFP